MKTVYLGMSGGVDSSVSAVLLQQQGYKIIGVYMKNWSRDLPGMKCPWAEDLADAKRVAVKLGIDFEVFDFETDYKQKVVDYMLTEFKRGRTPNPDITCNEEIKFKLFYDVARERGADFIATGHYARIGKIATTNNAAEIKTTTEPASNLTTTQSHLLRAVDENKDQTYFLYRISNDALNHTIFPIGDMLKPDVKKFAADHGLKNAYKKESMGVCFVGEVGIKDFLREYLTASGEAETYFKPGKIINSETGEKLGTHEGAIFYTIGQRHGLELGGGLPFYVTGKNMEKNEVYVSKNLGDKNLWTRELNLANVIIRTDHIPENIEVRLRHRAPLIPTKISFNSSKNPSENSAENSPENSANPTATLAFENEIRRPASGQSAVFYDDQICLGGGIIA